MRYTIRQYAAAFLAAYQDKSEIEQKKILRNFLSILRKNKDWVKLGQILHEVEKLYYRKTGLKKVEIETASFMETLRQDIKNILGKNIFIKEKVNPEVLAGVKILINDEILIDATAQSQLRRMLAKR
jgi:F0F1-type ATP synthase delta subunit